MRNFYIFLGLLFAACFAAAAVPGAIDLSFVSAAVYDAVAIVAALVVVAAAAVEASVAVSFPLLSLSPPAESALNPRENCGRGRRRCLAVASLAPWTVVSQLQKR